MNCNRPLKGVKADISPNSRSVYYREVRLCDFLLLVEVVRPLVAYRWRLRINRPLP
jgi:hypothetical protein